MTDEAEAHLERYRLEGDPADLEAAIEIVRLALSARPTPPARAALLRHRAACHHERYLAGAGFAALQRAVADYERALALLPSEDPLRPIVYTELGTALQDRFADREDPADLERAITLGRRAARAEPDGPRAPEHLINLGTAYFTRHEYAGRGRDLDAALRCWQRAARLLPEDSPYRATFHDRLTIGYWTRWEQADGGPRTLAAAIRHGRLAVRLGASMPEFATYAGHLAGALIQRWHLFRRLADLNEAITVSADAIGALDDDRARAPDLLANFAHHLLSRYQETGDPADFEAALDALKRARPHISGRDARSSVRTATARALAMRYLARGSAHDLSDAITGAGRAADLTPADSIVRPSRVARLSMLLALRYRRTGRRADLDAAISGLADLSRPTALQLHQLASYLAERHARDGAPADRKASVEYSRQAMSEDPGDADDVEPVILAGLASVTHDEFTAEGRFDDLDESVARHRAALRRTHRGSPSYPVMLTNLGLALRDRHVYGGDRDAADEAIRVHERALATAGPDSPDRPGYLDALAGAIQLRYERDGRPADLRRVIGLGEEALRTLPPRSPERPGMLAGLAATLSLNGDTDRAMAAYRAALRAMTGNRASRALVRLDYAQALAAQGRDTAAARAFRQAAAEADTPIARLDVGAGWGAWALDAGRWPEAATAFAASSAARRELLGAQGRRAHGERWLGRATEVAVGEAYARSRAGNHRQAVAALDGGRALTLSEQLEARAIAGRLRIEGHDALAGRYERAARRVADLTNS
jgi:tetratricopeptide (TPR) repeat protein